MMWKNNSGNWCRNCPKCGRFVEYGSDKNAKYYVSHCNRLCRSCSMIDKNKGKFHSVESKRKMSETRRGKTVSMLQRMKISKSVRKSMHEPEIRKRHLNALYKSGWLRVRLDDGQMKLLEKWNRLGFNFEPNYQIHTGGDLFYIDGYDKDKNVILEYDSKYHFKPNQKQKDLIRQHTLINFLKPRKFWRFIKPQSRFVEIIGDTHHG